MARSRSARALRPRRQSRSRQSLREFLAVPLIMVAAFTSLAAGAATLDRVGGSWIDSARQLFSALIPPAQSSTMLQTVAPGMITAVSITFFVMLMSVQQQAGTYTAVIVDQFMQRRSNQLFFGLFVGLAVYYVLVLAAVPSGRAVFSAGVALVLTVIALAGLLVFVYSVLDQLRPSSSVGQIQMMTLAARAAQESSLRRCRTTSQLPASPVDPVRSERSGYLVDIDTDALATVIGRTRGEVEIEFCVQLGSHLVPGTEIAVVRGVRSEDREALTDAVLDASTCARTRRVETDAAYGVDQLASMAWAASSSQQDPAGALVSVGALHSLLAHWGGEDGIPESPVEDPLPVVYADRAISKVLGALTGVIVATGQSGQHQTCARVLDIFALILPQLSPENQHLTVDHLRRVLSTATSQVVTIEMEQALANLIPVLRDCGFTDAATRLTTIESRLAGQVQDLSTA